MRRHSWRFDAGASGTGAIGDLGAHSIDLARYLVGEITRWARSCARSSPAARSTTPTSRPSSSSRARSARSRPRASRPAAINHHTWEINGSRGSLAFDLERMNELLDRRRARLPARARARRLVAARPHRRLGRHVHLRVPAPARCDRGRGTRSPRRARPSRTATAAPRSATRSGARPRPERTEEVEYR